MKKAFQCIVAQTDDALERFDLTYAQWLVLDQLHTSGKTGLLNLAKKLDLNAGALTRTIDRLENKGHIKRVRSEQDKRLCQIELTPKSQDLIKVIPGILAQIMNEHQEGFERGEYERLIHALNQLIKNTNRFKERTNLHLDVGEPQLTTNFSPT